MASRPQLARWSAAVGGLLRRRAEQRSPRVERALLVLSALVFLGAGYFAFQRFPDVEGGLEWWPLLLGSVGGVPPTVFLNGMEFHTSALMVGHRVPASRALRVTVIANAANLLPLPGAALVRVQALRQLGPGYREAVSATALIGAGWVAITVLIAGVAQLALGSPALGAAWTAVALVGLVIAYAWMSRRVGAERAPALAVRVALIEVAFVVVNGLRLFLIIEGLGFDVDATQAVALTVAGAAAAAVGIFPGGLGLREAIAAGISPLVGLPVAVGLMATVVHRLASFAVLGSVALGLAVRGPSRSVGAVADEAAPDIDRDDLSVSTTDGGPTDP